MLLEFFGQECSHCKTMEPLVERLQKEEALEVTRYEVWHNKENEAKQREYNKDLCNGVPFFYNTETNTYICGEVPYEELKNWATNK